MNPFTDLDFRENFFLRFPSLFKQESLLRMVPQVIKLFYKERVNLSAIN